MAATGIVTVVSNEKHNLSNFRNSLLSQTDKDFTLYFIDNNSSDGSAEYFKELNYNGEIETEYILLKENKGFSGGSNIGAKKGIDDGCKYLLILNNDVLMEDMCLKELRNLIDTDKNIACTGMLLLRQKENYPDIIQEYGGTIDYNRGEMKKNFENTDIKDIEIPDVLETDFIGGGAMLIRAEIFDKVGMFEEDYFGYFDEIDLSYRLKVQNNYKLFVTSKAKAYHNHYSVSGKNKSRFYFEYYLSERNKFLYFNKYGLVYSKYRMLLHDIIKFPRRLLWFKKVCDWKLGWYYLKGMNHGLIGRKGPPQI